MIEKRADILSDGTSRQYPGYEEQFASIALRLVRNGNAENCAQLAAVFHDDLKTLYVEAIKDRLGQSSLTAQFGGWYLLTSLADREILWATQMLKSVWPKSTDTQHAILLKHNRRLSSKWFSGKLLELAPYLDPFWLSRYMHEEFFQSNNSPEAKQWNHLQNLTSGNIRRYAVANRSEWSDVTTAVLLTPCQVSIEGLDFAKNFAFKNFRWCPIIAGVRFRANPSAKTLANELNWLSENWEPNAKTWNSGIPWPLAACINHATSKADLRDLANAAESGLLGDVTDWNAAEERWRNNGLMNADFQTPLNSQFPISAKLSVVGFPFAIAGWSCEEDFPASRLDDIIEKLRGNTNIEMRSWLARVMLSMWEFSRPRKECPTPTQYREFYSFACQLRKRWPREIMSHDMLSDTPTGTLSEEWIDFFDWSGREGLKFDITHQRSDVAVQLVHQFCSEPDRRRGLLPVIAEFAMAGIKCILPEHVLIKARSWSNKEKDYAISLSLARENVSCAEFYSAAIELVKSNHLPIAVWQGLMVASHSSSKQAAEFALAILDQICGVTEDEAKAEKQSPVFDRISCKQTKLVTRF